MLELGIIGLIINKISKMNEINNRIAILILICKILEKGILN